LNNRCRLNIAISRAYSFFPANTAKEKPPDYRGCSYKWQFRKLAKASAMAATRQPARRQ
jgi:hypothetical protein